MSGEKRTYLAKKMCALLLAVVFTAVAGEVLLRLFAPFPDYTSRSIRSFPDQYHPILGYTGIPRLDTLFILPDFRHRIVNNSRGFRDRERDYEKGDRKRMVILGDSTAWGWGVEAEDRFSDVMERQLKGWEVINLAQAGYSTDQELLVLETEGLTYRPDLVILLFDRNDVVEGNNARIIDGIQPKPFFVEEGDRLVLKNTPVPCDRAYWIRKTMLAQSYGVPGGDRDSRWSWRYSGEEFFTKSHFYNWLMFRLSHPVWSRSEPSETRSDRRELEKGMRLTKRLLKEIDRLCTQNGARLIIADIPSIYSPPLQDFCREEKIRYVDLDPPLRWRMRPIAHRRVGHWNRYGHRIVAEAIIDYLSKNGMLK